MKAKSVKIKTVLISAFLFACLSVLLGSFLASNGGIFDGWRSLGSPPERAIEIMGVDSSLNVYVLAENQEIYSCDPMDRIFRGWKETGLPEEWGVPYEIEDDGFSFVMTAPIASPPGEVVDEFLIMYHWGPEGATVERFVLLGDNTVWEWRNSSDAHVALFYSCPCAVAGMVLGTLVSIGWGMVSKRFRDGS